MAVKLMGFRQCTILHHSQWFLYRNEVGKGKLTLGRTPSSADAHTHTKQGTVSRHANINRPTIIQTVI